MKQEVQPHLVCDGSVVWSILHRRNQLSFEQGSGPMIRMTRNVIKGHLIRPRDYSEVKVKAPSFVSNRISLSALDSKTP